jgi:cytochrome c
MSADDVYAVTAFLLNVNGIIAESDVIDAKTLPAVRMPNRDGFVADPRPDVGHKKPGR